jgi:hypothetical protein
MAFVMQTSIHGRRLGISSTGGIVSGLTSTGGGSTAIVAAAQMWGDVMVATHSSSGATFNNYGVNFISSATAAAYNFTMPEPVNGVMTSILSMSSATTITIETTGVAVFGSTVVGGSSKVTFTFANGSQGAFIDLIGIGSTIWAVRGKTTVGSTVVNGVL